MAKLSRRAIASYVAHELSDAARRKKAVLQLAAHLVDTHRTQELPLIVRDIEYYLAENGMVNGTVTSAFDLSAETMQAIEKYVQFKTGAQSVSLEHFVDPSVVGGVKVTTPGHELDATVKRSLTLLKTRFKKAQN